MIEGDVMFEIEFYEDKRGRQPVKEALDELQKQARTSKDARIQSEKIAAYILALRKYGRRLGEPHIKHIDGSLWELRPLAHRVFFFHWRDNKLVLLHHFIKKTQKTPTREIEQARSNMRDFLERSA
ncbi:MAG: type II toxin-antitoxin system RelE/ParE family toxin [Planctomycetota bacterium]|jgi:phage-related protein|nr:type II toxin-antitoxin system RelE/ParE family toxin [Planctomycetota bacterium]